MVQSRRNMEKRKGFQLLKRNDRINGINRMTELTEWQN